MTLMLPDPTKPAFPLAPQIQWDLQGDRDRADKLRGVGLQVMEQLNRENVNDYAQYFKQVDYDDGSKIRVQRQKQIFVDLFTIFIYVPPAEQPNQDEAPELIPQLREGQFFWAPGCVARYGFREGKELQNEIPLKSGSLGDLDSRNAGTGLAYLSLKEAGLPAPGTSPDGTIFRTCRVCRMEGVSPDSDQQPSQIILSALHIPAEGPFSISCLVRLRQSIEMDYSFTPKTRELDNGYTVWNPIKPRMLRSSDGASWSADCPGSLAPLVGYKVPTRFSRHWAKFTLPWPDYNDDFVSRQFNWIGYREIAATCPDEPLLTSAYDPASPYWDKVPTSGLETLDGEFVAGWEENAEDANAAPYASFCTFKMAGEHGKDIGSRAVGTLSDGSRRYATVHAVSREYNPDGSTKTTTLTFKDYQYKLHLTDAASSLTFGAQPFPVCHPQGYLMGINLLGLCWYNGNRLLAGKVCDFESEYALPPVVSDPLALGEWHHALMTYAADGRTVLYVSRLGAQAGQEFSAGQSTGTYVQDDGFGDLIPVSVGADMWTTTPENDVTYTDDFSAWTASSFVDLGLLRFYRRALTPEEAVLLRQEALSGVFVADDFEAAQLIGAGLQPVVI
uniref:Uncharacterized protein n=1 Tax=Desulfovibrio sp. U5L TaxID=596152 RepID=I2Q023_9BACT